MYSFDIFDTILSRRTETPKGVFDVMQSKIQSNVYCEEVSDRIKNNFSAIRVAAEINACIFFSEKEQVTLSEIYYVFSTMCACSVKLRDELKRLEIETERELLVPINSNINKIRKLLSSGEKVVLISDMYLSKSTIRSILISYDNIFNDIPIYVSSEENALKETGELYRIVREKEGANYKEWIHIGDNMVSDYLIPSQLGIKAQVWEKNNEEKKLIIEPSKTDDELKKILVDLSLNCKKGSELAGVYAAFLLYDYIRWIIEISKIKEIQVLGFIARDGYVLKKIADIIIETFKYEISTMYVYGSRMSWKGETEDKEYSINQYMHSLCDYENKTVAFIDMQASGKSFKRMEEICNLDAYYFCYIMLNEGTRQNNKWYVYNAWDNINNYIEVLCRAPHGVTLGYEKKENMWGPTLAPFEIGAEYLEEYNRYVETVSQITRSIIQYECKNNELKIYPNQKILLDYLLKNPKLIVADFIGEIIHDANNEETIKFAPKLSKEQLEKCLKYSSKYNGIYWDYSVKRLVEKDQSYFAGKISYDTEVELEKTKELVGKKVIIYGAGKNGKIIYEFNKYYKLFNTVAWVDVEWERINYPDVEIISLKEALKYDYDYIYISIYRKRDKIKQHLVECGVEEDKIILD